MTNDVATLNAAIKNELAEQCRKEDHMIDVFSRKLEKSNDAFAKAQHVFIEIENQLDLVDIEEKNENGRRRKGNGVKSFEFLGVSGRAAVEDLHEIYEGIKETSPDFGPGNFRKGDVVNCIVDRKKLQGTIISANQKGLIIVTKDRKKIRISWEDIEDEEVHISRVSEEND